MKYVYQTTVFSLKQRKLAILVSINSSLQEPALIALPGGLTHVLLICCGYEYVHYIHHMTAFFENKMINISATYIRNINNNDYSLLTVKLHSKAKQEEKKMEPLFIAVIVIISCFKVSLLLCGCVYCCCCYKGTDERKYREQVYSVESGQVETRYLLRMV